MTINCDEKKWMKIQNNIGNNGFNWYLFEGSEYKKFIDNKLDIGRKTINIWNQLRKSLIILSFQ